jgi:hypothetical protein
MRLLAIYNYACPYYVHYVKNGFADGFELSSSEGPGETVGTSEVVMEGSAEGGWTLGPDDGIEVGATDGTPDGFELGFDEGAPLERCS